MSKKKSKSTFHAGIDLGTTNSVLVVVTSSGTMEIVRNLDGDHVTPSIVSVASTPPVVGKAARQDRFLNPEYCVEQFKRYMGQTSETGQDIPLVTAPDGTEYTPPMLSAEVLLYLKNSAEKLMGQKLTQVVIPVPAYFPEAARQATKNAGLIAGYEAVHIVDEPLAAASFYGLVRTDPCKTAVFDFGGGTFDICILEIDGHGHTTTRAIDGNYECGGGNVDEILMGKVQEKASADGVELSPDRDLGQWLEALDKCREAKEILARKDQAFIGLRVGDKRISMQLTNAELEQWSAPIIATLRTCCQRALDKSGLQASQIDKVLLVGGSTRLRFVTRVIREVFGQDPVGDTDPDLAVGRGAAILAAAEFAAPEQELIVEGKRYVASAIRSQSIAARDLCVAAITQKERGDTDEYNVPIITTGSELPYEALEHFTPIDAKTNRISVKLYDGHPGERSKDCIPLHEVEVAVQPTDDDQNDDRIEFKINMNDEGLVHIDVRDTLLNQPVPIHFRFHTGLSDSDIQEQRGELLRRHQALSPASSSSDADDERS